VVRRKNKKRAPEFIIDFNGVTKLEQFGALCQLKMFFWEQIEFERVRALWGILRAFFGSRWQEK
jgi:hypothetical protein